ncbi:transposase [Burkholderia cepacia]|uniref:transposase n=2 Tax=Burkholderia cepacia TaxID=292 RepID=UPI001C891C57|nr:transposase [Burkholderia cepacia]
MTIADTIRTSMTTPAARPCHHTGLMARLPRLDLPGIPQHVVQRGNNRLLCFLYNADRQRYLHLLRDALLHTGCLLHAYVLMDNHVHLLLTPPDSGATARLAYSWSSAAAHVGLRYDPLLTPHPAEAALGLTTAERGAAYRALLHEALSDDDVLAIRAYLQQQRALGNDAFKVMVEAKTQRFAGIRPSHRPSRRKET